MLKKNRLMARETPGYFMKVYTRPAFIIQFKFYLLPTIQIVQCVIQSTGVVLNYCMMIHLIYS